MDVSAVKLLPQAQHGLRVMAECFVRKRWEEAIAMAVNSRRVCVTGVDMAYREINGFQ